MKVTVKVKVITEFDEFDDAESKHNLIACRGVQLKEKIAEY